MKCHSNFIIFETHFFFQMYLLQRKEKERERKQRVSDTENVFALKSPVVFPFRVLVWLLSFLLIIRESLP